ncbi:MAG: hypothetical protein LWY06_18870 [Firmicutes bacterium]|nr:hypothetical protein [Bacillota bacterium]
MFEAIESIKNNERWQALQNYRSMNQMKAASNSPTSVQTNNASPEGNVQRDTAVMRKDQNQKAEFDKTPPPKIGIKECQTCKNRQYVDVSNDPGVSFKTPTHVAQGAAMSAVMAHESEHISNAKTEAGMSGREVKYQQVRIFTDICPECGKIIIAGGQATTVTGPKDSGNQNNNTQPTGVDVKV